MAPPLDSSHASDETSVVVPTSGDASEHLYMDFETYDAQQRKKARKRVLSSQVGLAVAAVSFPLIYLLANGQLASFVRQRHVLRSIPTPKSTIGVGFLGGRPILTPAEQKRNTAIATDLHSFLWLGVKANSREEQAAIDAYSSVVGMNFKDAPTVFRTVRQVVIPKYLSFVTKISAIQPKTPEVRKLDQMLLASIALRLKGYQDIAAAENSKNGMWQYAVRGEFDGSDKLAQSYKEAATQQAYEVKVELPK